MSVHNAIPSMIISVWCPNKDHHSGLFPFICHFTNRDCIPLTFYGILKSPATQLFVQRFVQTDKKKKKSAHYWPFVRLSRWWPMVPLTTGQQCGKPFHVMTSSWAKPVLIFLYKQLSLFVNKIPRKNTLLMRPRVTLLLVISKQFLFGIWSSFSLTGIMSDVFVDDIGDRIADYSLLDMTELDAGVFTVSHLKRF